MQLRRAVFILISWLVVVPSAGTGMSQAAGRPARAPSGQSPRVLFDGQSLEAWRGLHGRPIPDQIWTVSDGLLCVQPNRRWGDDIVTAEKFDNFQLEFEWSIEPGGNSGVKYLVNEEWEDPTRVRLRYGSLWAALAFGFLSAGLILLLREPRLAPRKPLLGILLGVTLFLCLFASAFSLFMRGPGSTAVGLEFQIFDAPGETPSSTRTSGALYGLLPPLEDAAKPAGEFNTGRINFIGSHIQHWVNGNLVLQFDLNSPQFREALQASKFAGIPFDRKPAGSISLQNHMNGVCFRTIRISEVLLSE